LSRYGAFDLSRHQLGWVVVSILFSWYAENFGSYNKTYGSLGALIAFMFWIWLSTIVILIGAELNAETEHQRVRDTTTGRPKPMGARGATMADTVGAKRIEKSATRKASATPLSSKFATQSVSGPISAGRMPAVLSR
jgi:Virulence factor BrkB